MIERTRELGRIAWPERRRLLQQLCHAPRRLTLPDLALLLDVPEAVAVDLVDQAGLALRRRRADEAWVVATASVRAVLCQQRARPPRLQID